MGVRRQIYLAETDDRLLEERSRATGVSVSALIRQAVQRCYGAGERITWEEFFSLPVRANSAERSEGVYDPLFDRLPGEVIEERERFER